MLTTREYARCNIAGDGKLFVEGSAKADKFKIIDMSAAGASIESKARLPEGTAVLLKIRLMGNIVDAFMDVKGRIGKPTGKGYEIEFIELTGTKKDEIDELMREACNME